MNGKCFASFRKIAITIGLAAGLAACSNTPDRLMPTGATPLPGSLDARGGTVRYYRSTSAPVSVAANSAGSFTLTITNCDAGTCDANHVTSDNQTIKSAGITVPAGFTGVSISNVSATGGKNWDGNLVSGVIVLGASTGNQGLDPGESVTVTFNATAPSNCATYDWLTAAYQDSLNAGALVTTTPYSLVGSQPQVAVTGCTSACRLGQGYWDNHYPASWPADVMSNGRNLGSVHYTAAQLEAILANNAVVGNGLLSLAHQLIAAKLNLANGANGSGIASTIAAADAMIGALVVPPTGSDSLAPAATSALTSALDVWNNSCN